VLIGFSPTLQLFDNTFCELEVDMVFWISVKDIRHPEYPN
jgi:hypothetical protein